MDTEPCWDELCEAEIDWDYAEEPEICRGYCQCCCGQKTQIATRTDKAKGWIKGQPLNYVKGHNLSVATRQKSDKALGHKTFDPNGYVRIQTSHGRKYQHILIAEQRIGRPLRFFGKGNPNNEIVHHKNGNKSDNSPVNLVVMTHAEHIALHNWKKSSGNKKYKESRQ